MQNHRLGMDKEKICEYGSNVNTPKHLTTDSVDLPKLSKTFWIIYEIFSKKETR